MSTMDQRAQRDLAALPTTFRYSHATRVLNERRLRDLLAAGLIERIGTGTYRKADADAGDPDLEEIAIKAPRAILCLRSALARHDLFDDIPSSYDIALPRGTWAPASRALVSWHQFDPRTFDLGRTTLPLGTDASIGLYGPERCILDAYRTRHLEGPELANEALRRWLRQGGQPSILLAMGKSFPRALPALRNALEILL